MTPRRSISVALLAATLSAFLAVPALAQKDYPAMPVKIVVPTQPGGSVDALGRLVADHLSKNLHQPVIVENKAGAGGAIGLEAVAKANPDGHTLVIGIAATFAVQPALGTPLPYDTVKDFAPIALFAQGSLVVGIQASSGVTSIADLREYAKKRGKTLSFGTGGQGTFGHLVGELIKHVGHVPLNHIPYKGSAPAVTDLMGNAVDLVVVDSLSISPFVKTGALRIIATAGPRRLEQFPNSPTLSEQGIPFELGTWVGLFAPEKTPPAVINKLAAVMESVARHPEFMTKVSAIGLAPVFAPTDVAERIVKHDVDAWKKITQTTGVKIN